MRYPYTPIARALILVALLLTFIAFHWEAAL